MPMLVAVLLAWAYWNLNQIIGWQLVSHLRAEPIAQANLSGAPSLHSSPRPSTQARLGLLLFEIVGPSTKYLEPEPN